MLAHIGSPPLQSLEGNATTQVFLQASRSTSLITNRVVGGGIQKLGYLLSARGPDGMYVIGASQQLQRDGLSVERVVVGGLSLEAFFEGSERFLGPL